MKKYRKVGFRSYQRSQQGGIVTKGLIRPERNYITARRKLPNRLDNKANKAKIARQTDVPVNPLLNKIVRSIGGLGSSMLGMGWSPGSNLASGLHQAFKNITGIGAYHISKNSIIGLPNDPPFINMNNPDYLRIQHREYIGAVNSHATPNTFSIGRYGINPTSASLFPWLSTIAYQFELYRFHGLAFEFKSTSSDTVYNVSANTNLGSVILSTQYNSFSNAFTKKSEMENHIYTVSTKPSISCLHLVECDYHKNAQMENLFTSPQGVDIRLAQMGTFNIASDNIQGSSVNLGELWVTYDIYLLKPRQFVKATLQGDMFDIDMATYSVPSNYFGTAPYLHPQSNLGTVVSGNVITFPSGFKGSVQITYYVNGGSSTVTEPTVTGTLGATAYDVMDGVDHLSLPSRTSTQLSYSGYWNIESINGVQPVITFSGSPNTGVAAATKGNLIITTVNPDLYPMP